MYNNKDYKVILASSSPRRKLLLSKIFENFEIVIPTAEEKEYSTPKFTALNNAINKGKSINVKSDVLIACDTIVAKEDKIYGKPKDSEDAYNILKELSGKVHEVLSGVYLRCGDSEFSFVESSSVKIKKLTDDDILNYIKMYNPLDKSGSYGIQDSVVVYSYLGDYDNINVLKINRIIEKLEKI